MPYVLYSVSGNSRVSELFASEQELWAYVRAQGLCNEVIEREDIDARTVLHPGYEIRVYTADGQRLDDTTIREWTERNIASPTRGSITMERSVDDEDVLTEEQFLEQFAALEESVVLLQVQMRSISEHAKLFGSYARNVRRSICPALV
jgi:hypothetical protein